MVIPSFVPSSRSINAESAQADAPSRVVSGIHRGRRSRVGPADDTGRETRVVWRTGVDQPKSASVNRRSGTASPTSDVASLSWDLCDCVETRADEAGRTNRCESACCGLRLCERNHVVRPPFNSA